MRVDNEQTQYIGIHPIAISLYEQQITKALDQLKDPVEFPHIHTAGLLLTTPRRLLLIDGPEWHSTRTYVLSNGTITLDITPTHTSLVYGEWYIVGRQPTEVQLRGTTHSVQNIWRFNRRRTHIQDADELRVALAQTHNRPVVPADLPMTWDNNSYGSAPRGTIETGMPRLALREALESLGIQRKVTTRQELVIK